MTLRTLLAASLSLLLAVPALAAPTKLAQQGRVLDSSGEPLEGMHAMSFSLFDAATDGSSLWTEERNAAFEAGYYSITLGEQVPLDDLLFAGESVWLEISIGGEALTPRQEVVSVPYALRATAAEHVEGGLVDAEEISVDGTVVIDATGNWVGPTPAVGWGDLSGVPADIADGDQDTDTLAGLACAEGQLPKWDATNSLWICGDDIDTTDPNTDTLQSLACATGQIAKWDGTAWSCGEDIDTTDPNTDVLAGLACTEGQLPKWDATNSLWTCADDIDTDTTDPNTDTLLTLVCMAGQVAKWDGTSWGCGDDIDTDTTDPNTDTLAALPCADGFIAKMDGTTGLWACAPDADSFAELAGVCLPGDIPVLDPVSGSWTCGLDNDTVTTSLPWSSITGIPADIADGDQDTVTLTLPWSSITGIPADIADGDQDTVTLTLPWSSITGIPADIADGDQDTDTQLDEAQVDAMVANNGYITVDNDTLASLACAPNEVAKWNGASWSCAADQDTETLSSLNCSTNEVAHFDGTTGSWACSSLLVLLDQDGDGAFPWEDCDDTDSTSTVVAADGDCDGTLTAQDCDDSESTSTVVATDGDCDGVPTASDCDDSDPSITSTTLGSGPSCAGQSCEDLRGTGSIVIDGVYWVTYGQAPFQVYCDMNTNGGGWALFARHTDSTQTRSEMPVVLPAGSGVLPDTKWLALRDSATTGMMLVDEFDQITVLPQSNFEAARCVKLSDVSSLVNPPLIGNGNRGAIWHDENQGCDVNNSDYTFISLHDGGTNNNTRTIKLSSINFSVWPYSSYDSVQNEFLYFIK